MVDRATRTIDSAHATLDCAPENADGGSAAVGRGCRDGDGARLLNERVAGIDGRAVAVDDGAWVGRNRGLPYDCGNSLSTCCITWLIDRVRRAVDGSALVLDRNGQDVDLSGKNAHCAAATDDDAGATIDDTVTTLVRSARAIAFAALHADFATHFGKL
jgi:hypothetical protein